MDAKFITCTPRHKPFFSSFPPRIAISHRCSPFFSRAVKPFSSLSPVTPNTETHPHSLPYRFPKQQTLFLRPPLRTPPLSLPWRQTFSSSLFALQARVMRGQYQREIFFPPLFPDTRLPSSRRLPPESSFSSVPVFRPQRPITFYKLFSCIYKTVITKSDSKP